MPFLYFLESIRNPVLDAFFSYVTRLGEENLFLIVAIFMFWCVDKHRGYYLLAVGYLGIIINQSLKMIFRVPRPWIRDPAFTIVDSARAEASGYSFPSGHTQNAVSVLGSVARSAEHIWVKVLCVILIALTALSRMYLGVHTLVDVSVSLLIGVVLIFVFYPLFEERRRSLRLTQLIFGVLTVCALAFVLYMELFPWPGDVDAHNLASGFKNGYTMLGCCAGLFVCCGLEEKWICFSTRATLPGQILKLVLGLVLVMGIRTGLKPVLAALFQGHPAADALRYFVIIFFVACVWPLTFRLFERLGRR